MTLSNLRTCSELQAEGGLEGQVEILCSAALSRGLESTEQGFGIVLKEADAFVAFLTACVGQVVASPAAVISPIRGEVEFPNAPSARPPV